MSRITKKGAVLCSALVTALLAVPAQAAITCARVLTAKIVAIDQPLMWNRLGAQNINGAIYALERDVVDKSMGLPLGPGAAAVTPSARPSAPGAARTPPIEGKGAVRRRFTPGMGHPS